MIDDLKIRGAKSYVSPYAIAMVYAGLGERDGAFEWLEKAFEVRDEWLVRLRIAPELSNIRPDPRYVELLRRVGLAP